MGDTNSSKAILFFVSILIVSVSSQYKCPFTDLYHLGDSAFDVGNAMAIPPYGHDLPAANSPYGETFPGYPSGRWGDGLLDIDVGATAMGFPVLTPYLGGNASANNAIIFAVASSTLLDRCYFKRRKITNIPPYAQSLNTQFSWLKKHIASKCSTPEDCRSQVGNSLVLFGNVHANDITYPLRQGISIEELKLYVRDVTRLQIKTTRELIEMGATRVILTGNVPIGCYPFILTELGSNDPADYDDYGCLKKINELIQYKNLYLQTAIANLHMEYNTTLIFYADFYSAYEQLLQEFILDPLKVTLKACCGVGGKYNYDSKRFCGSPGVTSCKFPREYIHFDGIHLTQTANVRLSEILQKGAMGSLNCTLKTPLNQAGINEE